MSLIRFGGLRCPSETVELRWQDIDWDRGRILARGGKTKPKTIPLYDEIRPHLEAAFEAAEEGAVHVITRYRSANANLRTQLLRILEDASLPAWPRPVHKQRQMEKETAVSPGIPEDTAVEVPPRGVEPRFSD